MSSRSVFLAVAVIAGCGTPTQESSVDTAPNVRVERQVPWTPSVRSPITGGTLVPAPKGDVAYASYADLDALVRLDFDANQIALLQFGTAARPGRLAFDANGQLHVVLRGWGAVADVDVSGPTPVLLGTRPVCADPRGIATDRADVLVACANGELVRLNDRVERTFIAPDLRDVVVGEGGVHVTTFRSAELINPAGRHLRPESVTLSAEHFVPQVERTFVPEVAWRTLLSPDGTLVMTHQRGFDGTIEPVAGSGNTITTCHSLGYSTQCAAILTRCGKQDERYVSVLHSAVTLVRPNGLVTTRTLNGALPVDVAVNPHDGSLTLLLAGSGRIDRFDPNVPDLVELKGPDGTNHCSGTEPQQQYMTLSPRGIALAYSSRGELMIQTERGAMLVHDDRLPTHLDLDPLFPGVLTADRLGFDMFHQATAGDEVACASCHPDGREDGRAWHFPEGVRRTQTLSAAATSVAPYHWDGSLRDFPALVDKVFVGRMGGETPQPETVEALVHWLGGQPVIPPETSAVPEAVDRGRALFEGQAGCSVCHLGNRLSSGSVMDVGTGGAFKVPSLLGVSRRLPLMHDGCAHTLAQRFDPACGGSAHGHVDALSTEQVEDLVAYLGAL
jgi:hypothetical protein